MLTLNDAGFSSKDVGCSSSSSSSSSSTSKDVDSPRVVQSTEITPSPSKDTDVWST
jgi:hypothetical protein